MADFDIIDAEAIASALSELRITAPKGPEIDGGQIGGRQELKLRWDENSGIGAFTGQDITAYAFIPIGDGKNYEYKKLGTLSLFSWGTMRTKSLVTSFGKAFGRGFTRGTRVVTGVMVFLQSDRSPFAPLNDQHLKERYKSFGNISYPDEMPPFDLLLTYVNERGDVSYRYVRHVEIVQGQGTDSVDESNPNESYSFVALDITQLTPVGSAPQRGRPKDHNQHGEIKLSAAKMTVKGMRNNFITGGQILGKELNGEVISNLIAAKPGLKYLADTNEYISSLSFTDSAFQRKLEPVIDEGFVHENIGSADARWDAIQRQDPDAFPQPPPDADEDVKMQLIEAVPVIVDGAYAVPVIVDGA